MAQCCWKGECVSLHNSKLLRLLIVNIIELWTLFINIMSCSCFRLVNTVVYGSKSQLFNVTSTIQNVLHTDFVGV